MTADTAPMIRARAAATAQVTRDRKPAAPARWRWLDGTFDHLIGSVLGLVYTAWLLVSGRGLGMARDEGFYVVAADLYAQWLKLVVENRELAFQRETIDRFWNYNSEHPALMKTLFALSSIAHEKYDLFPYPSAAYRFPGMLCGGLLVWLVFIFGTRIGSRAVGFFAAAMFALLPRVFYHSHLDCFDVPITLMLTAVTYAYWRSLTSKWWAFLTGLLYGLALATKHNAWILPGVFVVHFVYLALSERAARKRGRVARISYVPWWLVSMAVLGPLVFVASWPWLWPVSHEWSGVSEQLKAITLERFSGYAGFHLHHEFYNMAFFGRNYFWPPFPRAYPYVMIAFTVPATTLAAAFIGLFARVRTILPRPIRVRLWKRGAAPDRRATTILMVGALFAPIAPYLLPDTPIFGGTKHWFPAYPFLCLFGGIGAVHVVRAVRQILIRRDVIRFRSIRALLITILGAVILLPAALETVHSHPFGLSHYTSLAGFTPGAADHGMNRQFWGFTTGSVTGFLREQLPRGGSVWICDTTWDAWRMLERDGMLPPTIRVAQSIPDADFVLVHHEHHFAEVDFQAWNAFGSVRPAYVLTHDGVPIISVYENPRRRR